MTITMHQKFPVCDVTLWSTDGINCLDAKLNKLDRPVLTTLNNPRIADLKKKFPYLNRVWFDCEDEREQYPIHLIHIMGVGDMPKIKTATFKTWGSRSTNYRENYSWMDLNGTWGNEN